MAKKKQTTEDRLLMTSEAARLLRRSSQAVIIYNKNGRLPAMKTERGWRLFKESDVLKLAAELKGGL